MISAFSVRASATVDVHIRGELTWRLGHDFGV
jgi:hypothetical protein